MPLSLFRARRLVEPLPMAAAFCRAACRTGADAPAALAADRIGRITTVDRFAAVPAAVTGKLEAAVSAHHGRGNSAFNAHHMYGAADQADRGHLDIAADACPVRTVAATEQFRLFTGHHA